MKVFVIFLAVLIINISFLAYQGDMGRYLRTQTTVKAIAEECAAGAALFFDKAAYGEGFLVSNPEEGLKYIDYIIANSPLAVSLAEQDKLTRIVRFFDDSMICRKYINGADAGTTEFSYPFRFHDEQNKEIIIDEPSVVVTLKLDAQEIFRLPFLKTDMIVRSTLYELKTEG